MKELKFKDIWRGNGRLINSYCNKYHIQAAILDILLREREVGALRLEELVFEYFPTVESWYYMPVSQFQVYLGELYAIGAVQARIEGIEDDKVNEFIKSEYSSITNIFDKAQKSREMKNKTSLLLTDIGLELVRNQTYHSNALSSLSIRRMYKLSILTVLLSVIAMTISIIAICIN